MRSWPSSSCRGRTTSTSSAAIAGWLRAITACTPWWSPSATSRRRSSAARSTSWPIPTTTESTWRGEASSARPRAFRPRRQRAAATARDPLAQARGEYLYAACGESGLRVFDIAFIDNKGFSERIVTAPVSPLGQRFFVRTTYATAVAAPTTIAPDPTRTHQPENHEQKVHPLYGYIYVTDHDEGLILVPAGTLLDGNPLNNFLGRELTFNPDGILKGAQGDHDRRDLCLHLLRRRPGGRLARRPEASRITSVLGEPFLKHPRAVQAQFRYAYVCDDEGIKVLDITDLAHPQPVSTLPMHDARNIYLARTYAYVAAGRRAWSSSTSSSPRSRGSTRSSTPADASTT